MPKPPVSELPLTVRRELDRPLPLQLADQLRDAVRDGRLRAGHRLPATRVLARQLGVSRAVAQSAYDQLHAEGWTTGLAGSGTYVADIPPLSGTAAPRRTRRPAPGPARLTLRPGTPYVEPQVDAGWRRAWRAVAASTPPGGYDDPAGIPALRAALAEHVGRVRGITCRPEQLLATNGTVHGLRLLLSATTRSGDRIAIEDPGYPEAVHAAGDHELRVVDCPVDTDGARVSTLGAGLAAAYVTPSHQYPLGGRLPVARRHALVDWARRTGALVVEDDYDSEFRFDVAPLPALAQLDLDRVVHLGTLSKTLGPTVRFGWVVASEELVERLAARRRDTGDWPSWPVQRAVLAMLRDGYLDRVVRRGRRRYGERRERTCARLAPYGEIVGRDAGLHVTLLLPDGTDDVAVARRAGDAGVTVAALSTYRRSCPGPPGLVIGYGAPADDDLDPALTLLTQVLRPTA